MRIEYQINKEDLSIAMLYVNVQKKLLKKSINLMWFLPSLFLLFLAFAFYLLKFKAAWVISPSVLAVYWIFKFPRDKRRSSVNPYDYYIDENLADLLGQKISLEIGSNHLTYKTTATETVTELSELEQLIELNRVLLIILKSGAYYSVPKYQIGQANVELLVSHLEKNTSLNRVLELDWNWE